ncbi:MAG: hypothetical protein HFF36_06320 [Coprobacillus sp.]|nr:hypothetical protein [Coprobacillus sp.]
MSSANFISYWYEKFGQQTIQKWMETYDISLDSFIFKFQPSHLLDKILSEKDLFEYSKYVNGFNDSKLISYYTAKCNNYYQEKFRKDIEMEEEELDDEFNNIMELVWENVQDISVSVSDIKEYSQKIDDIYVLISEIDNILTSLTTKKVEKNAKYNQVEELRKMIMQIKEQLSNKKGSSSFLSINSSATIIFISIIIGFIIGGIIL